MNETSKLNEEKEQKLWSKKLKRIFFYFYYGKGHSNLKNKIKTMLYNNFIQNYYML